MKKKSVMLAMLLCASMLATSCGSNGDSGTTSVKQESQKEESKKEASTETEKSEVVIGFSREGDSFDPCTGFGYTGSPLYSTLVKVNGDDKLVNDLATGYEVSDDALTWTFKIRDNVKFTNGEALKASDVAFTFQTAKEKATYMDLTMMESCTAVDDTTVEFQLNKPCVTFIYTVAQMGIVPEKVYT
ncbi:MAG: ABC transporter substrate-binding protein, partial [Blautia sp.]|nr:ABC transporter substrate-binding protein [Blautia sp.]